MSSENHGVEESQAVDPYAGIDTSKFDTSGLELVPQEGEQSQAEMRVENAATITAEAQAQDNAQAKEGIAEIRKDLGLPEVAETVVAGAVLGAVAGAGVAEGLKTAIEKPIDAIEINNRIVNLRHDKQAEAIAALSPEEISAVAKLVLRSSERDGNSFDSSYGVLNTFEFTPELIAQPEVTQALKNLLVAGQHFYDIQRILHIPAFPKELLADQNIRNGLKEGLRRFVGNKSEKDVDYEKDLIRKVTDEMGLTAEELREVAEKIKGGNSYRPFIQLLGVKRLYPEVR